MTPGKWERKWAERMPRTRLELRPASGDEALAGLRDGSVSMGLVRDVAADDEFHAIALYREQAVVVAPRDHPVAAFTTLTLAELAGETILEGDGPDTLDLVEANVGLAMMPQSVARAQSRRELVARVVTDASDSGVALVWPVGVDDPRVDVFVGVVRGRTPNSSR